MLLLVCWTWNVVVVNFNRVWTTTENLGITKYNCSWIYPNLVLYISNKWYKYSIFSLSLFSHFSLSRLFYLLSEDKISKMQGDGLGSSRRRENSARKLCFCRLDAEIRQAWTDKNPGRRFYGCPRYKVSQLMIEIVIQDWKIKKLFTMEFLAGEKWMQLLQMVWCRGWYRMAKNGFDWSPRWDPREE